MAERRMHTFRTAKSPEDHRPNSPRHPDNLPAVTAAVQKPKMSDAQIAAYGTMLDMIEDMGRLIIHAKASAQPLQLPQDILDKLTESRQALIAANQLMEKLL